MNISKALKVKNRLAGETTRLQTIIQRENSRRNDNESKVDVAGVFVELENSRGKLINLKGAIAEATSPISKKLAELAETKTEISFYQSLPTREGEELTLVGSNRDKLSYHWTAYYNRQSVDEIVKGLQDKVNSLQDEIDDFNAKTQVDFAE